MRPMGAGPQREIKIKGEVKMKKTTVKVKQRIQHFVVMTVDGEEEVFIPGTIEQARREIRKKRCNA